MLLLTESGQAVTEAEVTLCELQSYQKVYITSSLGTLILGS